MEHQPLTEPVKLSPTEARVVGCLIEKSFLTPDVYPMTTNATVGACNQKTNRDPVMSVDAVQVDQAFMAMRERGVVRRVHVQGSRSTKHRHCLDELLNLDDEQLAIVSVLLLRGPQTPGELRQRTERHIGFETLDQVDAILAALGARATPIVRQLARQPGQKEARWQHLLLDGDAMAPPDPERPESSVPEPSVPESSAPSTSTAAPAGAPSAAPAGTTDHPLGRRVEALEAEVADLRAKLEHLAGQLGEALD